MAITQNTSTDVTAPPVLCLRDEYNSDATSGNPLYYYERGGGTRAYFGAGAPAGTETYIPIGSEYTDTTNGKKYLCTALHATTHVSTFTVMGSVS